MSISWVGCQSKMDVPFNRFLCLQTNKRKHLGSSLEDAGNGPTRTPVPSPIYGEREREREKGKNHEHQLGLLNQRKDENEHHLLFA